MRVGFRTVWYKDDGLRRAPVILAKHLRGILEGIGKRLTRSSVARMREDLGSEKKSLRIKVTGSGLNLELRVISELAQAFVDAYGLKRGTFPPYQPGSRLYAWALRKEKTWEVKKTVPRPKGTKVKSTKRVKRVTKVKGNKRIYTHARIRPTSRKNLQNSGVRRIAFLVARAIYKRGIKPNHWNTRALEANRQQIIRDLQNGLERAAREINRG